MSRRLTSLRRMHRQESTRKHQWRNIATEKIFNNAKKNRRKWISLPNTPRTRKLPMWHAIKKNAGWVENSFNPSTKLRTKTEPLQNCQDKRPTHCIKSFIYDKLQSYRLPKATLLDQNHIDRSNHNTILNFSSTDETKLILIYNFSNNCDQMSAKIFFIILISHN